MPYPVATGRIVIPYTVDGLNHHIAVWVRNPQLVGSVWQVNSRATDSNDTDWEDVAQKLADCISFLLATGTTAGAALLQTRVGGVFTTRATVAVSLANLSGTRFVAQQTTIVLRDLLFNRFKLQIMECTKLPGRRLTGITDGDAQEDSALSYFEAGVGTLYNYIVSGWDEYMVAGGFVSYVTTLNRKLRRARGVA